MSPAFSAPGTHARELVVNWHITEACNYRCRYCFAKWQRPGGKRELIRDPAGTEALLTELFRYFHSDKRHNLLHRELGWDSVRLNLAGGEPLLYGQETVRAVEVAREIGFDVSVISNGSRLDHALMKELAPHLTMLGLSLDSADAEASRAIGRMDHRSTVAPLRQLADVIASGRWENPRLRLKINTVVNALNWREDLTNLVRSLAPEKWKVLRMLPTVTDDLAISDAQFEAFVERHRAFAEMMRPEDNTDMAESYIMIDPHGRFFQNALGRKGYDYSAPVLDAGAAAAFAEVGLSAWKFSSRYSDDPADSRA